MSTPDPRAGCGHDAPAQPVAQARQRILDAATPVRQTEQLPLKQALHRVLAAPVASGVDVPAHTNSAMDGYALRAQDLAAPGALRLVGESFAGRPYAGRVEAGQCVRIMTGAVLPAGADSVIMQERAERRGADVHFSIAARPGENVRAAGEDYARGQPVLAPGRRLAAADLGVLASVGVDRVAVYRRPRVAFFSTGDELRGVGQPLAPGEIYDSNRYSLHGMLAELGVEIEDLGVIRDEPAALRAALQQAGQGHDAVLSSGGVSVGEADYMLDILAECGEVDFWQVAIKPGRPLAFGRMGGALYFGLPGNPVSVMVTFLQLVRPALVRLSGGTPAPALQLQLPLRAPVRHSPGRCEYQRARLVHDEQGPGVMPLGHQGSGVLRSMAEADCFIVLDEPRKQIPAGSPVCVEPFMQPVWQR
jgi:molybdopterin molybdotransferase